MKRLILLRHAKTEPYEYDKDDFSRNLTIRGISDAHLICDTLKTGGYHIDAIISSRANRARQTATIFAEHFSVFGDAIAYNKTIYDGITTQEMLNMVANSSTETETALFVGHNPDIARFAYRLSAAFQQHVPTCCAIVFETEIEEWQDIGTQDFILKDVFIPKNYK